MSRSLIYISLTWLFILIGVPVLRAQPAAFFATVVIIGVNAFLSLRSITIQRTLPIALNCVQIALFGILNCQLACAIGNEHYRFHREPSAFAWLEFTAAHVLRAADVLDWLDESGIHRQAITHRSVSAGVILVAMHLSVDAFLLGLLVRWAKRIWGEPAKESRLARDRRIVGWFLVTLALYGGFAVCQGLAPSDWLLWPLDQMLRLVDVGDVMQVFGWQLHGVESNAWTIAGAVAFRLTGGIWMARLVLYLRATMFRTWGLSIDELIELLDDPETDVRHGAAVGLGRSGANAAAAVPALIELLHDIDDAVRCASARALGRIGPAARDATPPLLDAVWVGRRNLRRAAAAALARIGPAARWADSLAYLWIAGDSATRAAVAEALSKTAPGVLARLQAPRPKRKPWQECLEAAERQLREEEAINIHVIGLVEEGFFDEERDTVALQEALNERGRRVQLRQLFEPLVSLVSSGRLRRGRGANGRWVYRQSV